MLAIALSMDQETLLDEIKNSWKQDPQLSLLLNNLSRELQPYKQGSVRELGNHKLSPLYYDHYCILDKIEDVAYKLALPKSSMIHPTFNVSKLKRSLSKGRKVSSELQNPTDGVKVPPTYFG